MKGDRLLFSGLKCACGGAHQVPTQDLYIARDAAKKLPRFLKKRDLGRKAVLVSDRAGFDAAGARALAALRAEGFEVAPILLTHPLADERALGEVMLTMRMDTECFIGVGAEAVAAVTRAAAAQTERPAALVVTRPDGCGYLTREAPMLFRGEPVTLPAVAAEIVAFDLNALTEAPPEAYAQGLMDLAACHLARADWAALKLLRGDAYCPLCADMAAEAAQRAFDAADRMAGRGEEGARALAESLLMAGVAAFVSGGGRPVSGAAQRMARRAAPEGTGYAGALCAAVPALLDAYRSYDPPGASEADGSAAARGALAAHEGALRQVLQRLPEGAAVAEAVFRVAPGLRAAPAPLCSTDVPGDIAACETLIDFAALAGCPLCP